MPHAGYPYSGPVAAHFYRHLAEDGFPEAFIIIGPNHWGYGPPVATTLEDFRTPLGVVEIDRTLARDIIGDVVAEELSAHIREHSIEVQLPFLQFFREDVKFVPISMYAQDPSIAARVGDVIRSAISGRDVVVIASSDFSHYVPKNWAYKHDLKAIEALIQRGVDAFYRYVVRHDVTACGIGPIAAAYHAVGGRVELLKYATSGDMFPMDEVVGYASIAFWR